MSSPSSEVLRLARPVREVRAKVRVRGELAIVELEDGGIAVVPAQELCRLAERFNIIYENYKC
ncbi:MAG: hypothetical protein ABWW69_04510 [Pyrodictiaceae archaeon]